MRQEANKLDATGAALRIRTTKYKSQVSMHQVSFAPLSRPFDRLLFGGLGVLVAFSCGVPARPRALPPMLSGGSRALPNSETNYALHE